MLSSVLIHTCHRPTKILANCILRFYRFQFLLDFAFCWILYQFSTSTHVTFFSKKKSYKDNDLKCNEKYFSIRFSLLAPMAPDIKKEAYPKMLVLTVTGLGLSYQIDPPHVRTNLASVSPSVGGPSLLSNLLSDMLHPKIISISSWLF